jgi:hypothetical protein
MTTTEQSKSRSTAVLNRIADRIDLAIDVLTLGQYGLEEVDPAGATSCGESRRSRTSLPQPSRRRGDCEPSPAMSWDWPHTVRDAVSG